MLSCWRSWGCCLKVSSTCREFNSVNGVHCLLQLRSDTVLRTTVSYQRASCFRAVHHKSLAA
jgi:hypothetical protein